MWRMRGTSLFCFFSHLTFHCRLIHDITCQRNQYNFGWRCTPKCDCSCEGKHECEKERDRERERGACWVFLRHNALTCAHNGVNTWPPPGTGVHTAHPFVRWFTLTISDWSRSELTAWQKHPTVSGENSQLLWNIHTGTDCLNEAVLRAKGGPT